MLLNLIAKVFELCLLRRGPQDLPYAPALALIALAIGLALEGYSARLAGGAQGTAFLLPFSGAFTLAATWGVLRLRKAEARFWQTLLALTATGVVFSLLALPVIAAIGPIDPDSVKRIPQLLGWAIIALACWRLLVVGHVWRHALDIPLPTGVLVALGLFIAEYLLQHALLMLFGAAPAS